MQKLKASEEMGEKMLTMFTNDSHAAHGYLLACCIFHTTPKLIVFRAHKQKISERKVEEVFSEGEKEMKTTQW